MNFAVRIVVHSPACLGGSWLVAGEASIVAALIGTAAAMGMTRLVNNSRWSPF